MKNTTSKENINDECIAAPTHQQTTTNTLTENRSNP